MSAPQETFHLEKPSSEESEDEEWVTDKEDNDNKNHDSDFKKSNTSVDEREDYNELN